MGIASVRPADVPVLSEKPMIGAEVQADGGTVRMTAVSVGNPHAVLFLPEIRSLDLEKIGPGYERHPLFPDRVNTEFARVVSRDLIEMRVWERGSGETYACGTGACATAVAAVLNGYADYETPSRPPDRRRSDDRSQAGSARVYDGHRNQSIRRRIGL